MKRVSDTRTCPRDRRPAFLKKTLETRDRPRVDLASEACRDLLYSVEVRTEIHSQALGVGVGRVVRHAQAARRVVVLIGRDPISVIPTLLGRRGRRGLRLERDRYVAQAAS